MGGKDYLQLKSKKTEQLQLHKVQLTGLIKKDDSVARILSPQDAF